MIIEYTDCTELKRLISDQKIKPSVMRKFLKNQGAIFTAANPLSFSDDVYTIFLGGQDIERITQMIIHESNYEKSTLINAKLKNVPVDGDILDFFSDGLHALHTSSFKGYDIEMPTRRDDVLTFYLSYKRTLPGKSKLIREETRRVKVLVRKNTDVTVSFDIRQTSSMDASKAIDLLQKVVGTGESAEAFLSHVNLERLTSKNKVEFFDKLSNYSFPDWRLKTVTGLTVKKAHDIDEDDNAEITEDDAGEGVLTGINQAVLNGSGLRSNEFVQNSLEQGYYITAMEYRYSCAKEAGEFIVAINAKGDDLRVDIEKSYYEEDGRLYMQPFPKELQDEIIQLFQKAANDVFYALIDLQKKAKSDD